MEIIMSQSGGRAEQNSRIAAENLRRVLADTDLSPKEAAFDKGIAYRVSFDGPVDQGIAQVYTRSERFVFHFIFTGHVPEDDRADVAEFITRVNWGMIEGNFEMDFDSGALAYKVGLDFTSTELTEFLIRNAIVSGMQHIENVAAPLQTVIDGEASPAEAMHAVAANRAER